MKRIFLTILIAILGVTLFASSFSYSGTPELFREDGTPVDASQMQDIGYGWIVRSRDTSLMVVTPIGSVTMAQNSVLVATSVEYENPVLYLVDGKATFASDPNYRGELTVKSPVSTFTADKSSMFEVYTTESEEKLFVYAGEVRAHNDLTGLDRQIKTLDAYDFITDTVITLDSTELVTASVDNTSRIVIPDAPVLNEPVVHMLTPVPPVLYEPSVIPVAPAAPAFNHPILIERIPDAPESISVDRMIVRPAEPSTLKISKVIPLNAERPMVDFVITVTPVPEEPSSLHLLSIKNQQIKRDIDRPIIREEKEQNSIRSGVKGKYQFRYHPENKDYSHRLTVSPYFESDSFSIDMNFHFDSDDFQSWTFQDDRWNKKGTRNMIATLSSHINKLTILDPYSPLFIEISKHKGYQKQFIPESCAPLNISGALRFGELSATLTGYDIDNGKGVDYFNSALNWEHGRSHLSLGSYYQCDYDTQNCNAIPYLDSEISVVNTRTFRLSLLLNGSGYVKLSPELDFNTLYNEATKTFDNYHLEGGMAIGSGKFNTSLVTGRTKGNANPFIITPFTLGQLDTSFSDDIEVRGRISYIADAFSFKGCYHIPITEGRIATLTGSGDNGDYLTFETSLSFGFFSLYAKGQFYGLSGADTEWYKDPLTTYEIWTGFNLGTAQIEAGIRNRANDTTVEILTAATVDLTFIGNRL